MRQRLCHRTGWRPGCLAQLVRVAPKGRLSKDEVRHRDFGWTLLEWLLSTPSSAAVEAVEALAAAELPHLFERLRTNYAFASLGQQQERDAVTQRWGLMPMCDYAQALLETYERDYRPRFADLGIDAERAWAERLPRAGS